MVMDGVRVTIRIMNWGSGRRRAVLDGCYDPNCNPSRTVEEAIPVADELMNTVPIANEA